MGSISRQTLRIASRQSDLARIQTEAVAATILKKFPEMKVEFHFRASLGDQNQNDPLWKMPEKGVFTEDFYDDLVSEKVDLVVHSWKDLPTELKPDTEIIASLSRADQRDLFLFKSQNRSMVENKKRLKILTSSPRRAYNLEAFFKTYFPCVIEETEFLNVRGNILTRLKKLMIEDADGLIVAKAAIDRLLSASDLQYALAQKEISEILKECQWMCLPLTLNPTAAAQGAIAIEIKKTSPFRQLLSELSDGITYDCVTKEREILAGHGGGCHQKIGVSVMNRTYGEITILRGFSDGGEILNSIELKQSTDFLKARSLENVFPRDMAKINFFERVPLSSAEIDNRLKDPFLWVAKEDAVPNEFAASRQQVIWTSGLKTWRGLARRKIWVNGSAESLGEQESARIDNLVQTASARWTKLTHQEGFQNPTMKTIATYKLEPRDMELDFSNVTHFFWPSGSSFDFALMKNPEIKKAWHFCGPGHSFEHIKKCLGSDNQLRICLSFKDWLNKVI